MRASTWTAAALLGLVLATPAWAQRTVTFGGASTGPIVNVPVDTSNAVVPLPTGQLTRPRTMSTITSFFGNLMSFGQKNSAQSQLPKVTTGPDSSYFGIRNSMKN